MFVRSRTPSGDERVVGEALDRSERGLEARAELLGRACSAGVPTSSASASVGAAVRSARDAGPQVAEQALRVRQERPRICGSARVAASSAGGPPRIDCCMRRRDASASAANVVSRLRKSAGLGLGHRRDDRARSARAPGRSATAASRGSDRFCITGTRLRSSGLKASIARLRSAPRPANAVPNSSMFVRPAARVRSSNVLKTSSSSTGAGVAWRQRDRRAVLEARGCSCPRVICTYFSPSAERGRTITRRVDGQRLDRRLELQRRAARRPSRPCAHDRRDRVDRADPRAADPHVVADDEVGRVRDLGASAGSVGTNGRPEFAL